MGKILDKLSSIKDKLRVVEIDDEFIILKSVDDSVEVYALALAPRVSEYREVELIDFEMKSLGPSASQIEPTKTRKEKIIDKIYESIEDSGYMEEIFDKLSRVFVKVKEADGQDR